MKHYFFKYYARGVRKSFFLLSVFLIYSLSGIFAHAQGTEWERLYFNPNENREFMGLASNTTRFVAIGYGGLNYTSSDGLKWKAESKVPTTYFGLTYGNGKFVAVGFKGSIITSSNGISWTAKASGVTSNFRDVVYAADKNWFVGIAAEGQIAISKDGGSTFSKSVDPSLKANAITYGNGQFVLAEGVGRISYSADAVNWTNKKIADKHFLCATYGNVGGTPTYIVAGDTYVFSSTDGVNWFKRLNANCFFHGATYTGSYFILVGEARDKTGIPIYTSPNGIAWTKRTSYAGSHLFTVHKKSNTPRVVAMGVWSSIVQSDNIAPQLKVTNPKFTSGTNQMTVKSGSTIDITWTVTGSVGNIKLEYSTTGAGGSYTTIADSVLSSNLKYSWTVPNVNSTNCIIRVSELDGAPLIHSAPFTISDTDQPTITITSPNGGETLTAGTSTNITWTGSTAFTGVDIEYYDGSTWNVIVTGTKDDGSYSWTVPNISTTKARLWMKGWSASGNPTDYTDNSFTIAGGVEVPTITITAPNGGETLTGGNTYTLRWQSSTTFDNVDLEYYNGSKWVVIKNGTEDDGSYSWTVPNISTSKAQIWIKGWSSNGNPTDFSDSTFTITPAPAGSITVTSPNGGEVWAKGSTENITWTSSGEVGNVRIKYATNNEFDKWTTIVSSTANDGSYTWKLPDIIADNCLVKVVDTANSLISDVSNDVFFIGGPPQIVLDKTRFNFGYIKNGASPCVQTLFIYNGGGGTLNWTAEADASWINLNPTSATGGGSVTVAINTIGLSTGSFMGTITVSDPDVENSPQTAAVYLTVKNGNQDQVPFGTFATPEDGLTGVTGSIAVTGWALDDTCVESVKIYRQVNGGLSFIGDAVFVEGPRPDVEQAYPDYPNNYRAGWGYMMLTNFLPDGQLVLKAIAKDTTGHQVELGTKTITVDNANAINPFGAIDTPTQGGAASGTKFRNNGWALTPQPNKIPENGSTINVFIDGVFVDNVSYNVYRSDIAGLFPGYANTNGSWGYLDLDTTAYTNGVHTIAWSVTDNVGNTDGVGSRYFSIQNTGSTSGSSTRGTPSITTPPGHQWQTRFTPIKDIPWHDFGFIEVKRGYNLERKPQKILPDKGGAATLEANELDRIEIKLNKNISRGYLVVGSQLRLLPIGSSLDTKKGIFYWLPGPGFLGHYELVFVGKQETGEPFMMKIHLKINPKNFGK